MRERKEAERKSIYFAEGDSDILKYQLRLLKNSI